ncbi:MAG: amidohydrolase [Actinomycetia bacterium]|nr:amidohydrolase [Actinomycetes bacterium]
MYEGTRVVDADGHLLEPTDVFEGRIDPKHLEHAPVVRRRDDGYAGMSFDGGAPPQGGDFGSGDAVVPGGINDPKMRSWDDGMPGGFDPHQRIADHDLEGIDAAVMFPTLGLFSSLVQGPEAQTAYCRALNDFYHEYCSAHPTRLFATALLPLADVDGAVAEVHRAAERGVVAMVARPNPDPFSKRQINDAAYEPIFAAAAEAGLPICFHEGVNPMIPFAGLDRCQNMFDWHCVSHPFEQMLALLGLVRAGVMERHPTLKFGFMESNCGWLPFWLDRLDSNWKQLSRMVPDCKMLPSEYFMRQCAIGAEADEHVIPAVIDLHPGVVLWASDYPHYDAEFPGAVKEMFEREDLTDAQRAEAMAGNADHFFGLQR